MYKSAITFNDLLIFMKYQKVYLLCFTIFLGFTIKAQESLNINFLSNFEYSEELSDVWGYSTSGGEYALVGVYNGISVVDVSIPTNPIELAFFPGDESIWRDLKTWENYLYCINETGGGLQIVNLTEVIAGDQNPSYIENTSLDFTTAHNIFIDKNGVLYVFGANLGIGGCAMFDLTANPEEPEFLGYFNDYYLHDGMVRGDTLWGGAIDDGVFSAIDVSDKSNPVIIGSHPTPNTYSHNCWISDDGNSLFTTDEVSGAYVAAYDVSDLSNIEELDRIQSWSASTDVIPHNTHVDGNFIVTSYYADGLSVVDVSNPSNLVEVAYYDTSDGYDGNGFNGAWGAYPWLPSGNILVTDIENGLFVLEPKYTSASFFSGSVTTIEGVPISGVMIQIEDLNLTTYSSLDGSYESGVPNQGTYTVTYSAPGYQDLIIEVDLTTGESLNFSPQLALVETYAVQISVVDALDFMGLPAASIHVYNDDFDFEGVTDQNGFVSNSLISGTYNVSIGLWGYQTICTEITLDGTMVDFSFELDNGYSDDFSIDLGWSIESDVSLSSGAWERVVPSSLSNDEISYSPTEDVSSDCGASAFVTDNGQSQSFEYTVDYQNWGGSLNATISGFIIHTDDQNAQACDVISSDLSGAIALIRRGSCEFGLKALNAQNAGASAVIIYNNEDTGQPLSTSGGSFGNEVSIPVFSITGSDGLQLVALLEANTNMSCSLTSNDLIISIANPSDVSSGFTRIISPSMDLSSYQSVSISYSTWFQNISEVSPPANDSLLIKLSNGEETILVDYRTVETASSNWQNQQVDVPVDFSLTQNMQLILETMDLEASNHLVEAGFDQFSVSGSLLSITQINNNPLSIFPNPSVDGLLKLNSIDRASLLSVHDLSGKLIAELNLSEGSNAIDLSHVVKGTYIIQLLNSTQSLTALWIRN